MATERIAIELGRGSHAARWRCLVARAGDDAPRLLRWICRLDPPRRIDELHRLDSEQAERGAGFYGMLPDPLPNEIPVPADLDASLDVAIRLAEIRATNLRAVAEAMPDYPLAFTGRSLDPPPINAIPGGWSLTVDLGGIREVLELFATGFPDDDTAARIARHPAFAEMLRHRRELGYVPEPVIDADGLTWCLTQAARRDPIRDLWVWLHPHNLFDFADLHIHRDAYLHLMEELEIGDRLAIHILARIAPYAPANVVFRDRLSFAVGWGIRGWATEATGGMNVEHAKDDFDRLLRVLVHETFHRLQTRIAVPHPGRDGTGFERITSYPFSSAKDRRLYTALCYVMLEGSATYVAAPEPDPDWERCVPPGLALLDRVLQTSRDEEVDTLLNEGLRSNGPFYGLGAALSRAIVDQDGPRALGMALRSGAPRFVNRAVSLRAPFDAAPTPALAAAIAQLSAQLGDERNPP